MNRSIGFVYSKKNKNGDQMMRRPTFPLSSDSDSSIDPLGHKFAGGSCTCDAARLQEELDCLRGSTRSALQQSWDEVETLNKKCSTQDDEILYLKEKLASSMKREGKIEKKLEKSIKDLKTLKKKNEKQAQSERERSNRAPKPIPRATSSGVLGGLLKLDFSTHSVPAHTLSPKPSQPFKRMGGLYRNDKIPTHEEEQSRYQLGNNSSFHSNANPCSENGSCLSEFSTRNSTPTNTPLEATSGNIFLNHQQDDIDNRLRASSIASSSKTAMSQNSLLQEQSNIQLADVVEQLKSKLESREKEIELLENVIKENMLNLKQLHLLLEERKQS